MTSFKALKPLICAFSIAVLSALALCSDLTDFRDQVRACTTADALQKALNMAPDVITEDTNYRYYLEQPIQDRIASIQRSNPQSTVNWKTLQGWLLEQIDAEVMLPSGSMPGKVKDPRAAANQILSNPLYLDPKRRESRNWIGQAAERMGARIAAFLEWLSSLFHMKSTPGIAPGAGLLNGLRFVAWALIILAIAVVLFFVIKNYAGASRKRRVGGILEDDEPDRTADQWLEHAELLASEGRYREGVRCLYIACLVRYDDGRIARFRRYETNWEHLYRIEASPTRPQEIDFRHVTQRFDKIWYGHMVKGVEDYDEFKEVYTALCEALKKQAAA